MRYLIAAGATAVFLFLYLSALAWIAQSCVKPLPCDCRKCQPNPQPPAATRDR